MSICWSCTGYKGHKSSLWLWSHTAAKVAIHLCIHTYVYKVCECVCICCVNVCMCVCSSHCDDTLEWTQKNDDAGADVVNVVIIQTLRCWVWGKYCSCHCYCRYWRWVTIMNLLFVNSKYEWNGQNFIYSVCLVLLMANEQEKRSLLYKHMTQITTSEVMFSLAIYLEAFRAHPLM